MNIITIVLIIIAIIIVATVLKMFFKSTGVYIHKKTFRKIRVIHRIKKYNSHSDWFIIFKDVNNNRMYILEDDYFISNYIPINIYKKEYGTITKENNK